MRSRLVLAEVMLLVLGACGNDKMHLHPDGVFVDAPPVDPWWMPEPGEANNWDIQINAPFDFTTPRSMMIVDLWTSVPSEMQLDYADGSITVPAGAQPTTIATLEANDTIVICRVGLGGMRTTDVDAARFPEASRLEIDPKMPSDERLLDLADRAPWEAAAFERIEFAKEVGCDGIEPYRIDHFGINTNISLDQQRAWYAAVAAKAHEHELSVGMRNGPQIYQTEAALFDWAIIERCAEDNICDQVRPVLELQKAVFALDFTTNLAGTAQDPMTFLCPRHDTAGIEDGLVKNVELSSAVRVPCE